MDLCNNHLGYTAILTEMHQLRTDLDKIQLDQFNHITNSLPKQEELDKPAPPAHSTQNTANSTSQTTVQSSNN